MSMYAEERQQAMAQLVAERGRLSVSVIAERVRRHHRDRAPRPLRPRADGPGPPGARRRGAAAQPGRDRVRARRARLRQHRAEGADRPRGPRPAARPPARRSSSTPARRPAASPACSPATTASSWSPTRCRWPPGWPATRRSSCTCCPAGSAPRPRPPSGPTPSRRSGQLRADVALPRHQRHQRRPRPVHPRPRRGRHQARHGRQRRRIVVLADASKIGTESRSASPRSTRSTCSSPTTPSATPTAAPSTGPASRSWSHDRHPDPQPQPRPHGHAGRPRSSAAPCSAPSRCISQAGGKGVNISRASVAAGIPSIAVLPAPKDDPFVLELLAAGIDCRPVDHHGGALRVNITISEPDGTTTKLNSPGPTVTPEVLTALTESLRRRAASRRLGGAGRLAAARRAGRVVRRPRRRAARLRRPRRRRHQRRPAARAGRAARRGSAPHLMKPNGEELASFTGGDADVLESDPEAAAAAAAHPRRPGRRARCWPRSARTAPCSSPPTAPGTPLPRPPTVVSTVGAGDSSLFGYLLGDIRQRTPAQRLALAVAYGSAAAGLPGTTIPHPSQVRPELVSVRDLDLTQGG